MSKPLTAQETIDYAEGKIKPKQIYVGYEQVKQEISRRLNLFPEDVDLVVKTTLDVVADFLSMSNRDQSVTVNLRGCLDFQSYYKPNRVSYPRKIERLMEEGLAHRINFSSEYTKAFNENFRQRQEVLDYLSETRQNALQHVSSSQVYNYTIENSKYNTEASEGLTEDFVDNEDEEDDN